MKKSTCFNDKKEEPRHRTMDSRWEVSSNTRSIQVLHRETRETPPDAIVS